VFTLIPDGPEAGLPACLTAPELQTATVASCGNRLTGPLWTMGRWSWPNPEMSSG